jgi:hypothetical protein
MPAIERPDPRPARDVDPVKEVEARRAAFEKMRAYINAATDEIAREYGYQPPAPRGRA